MSFVLPREISVVEDTVHDPDKEDCGHGRTRWALRRHLLPQSMQLPRLRLWLKCVDGKSGINIASRDEKLVSKAGLDRRSRGSHRVTVSIILRSRGLGPVSKRRKRWRKTSDVEKNQKHGSVAIGAPLRTNGRAKYARYQSRRFDGRLSSDRLQLYRVDMFGLHDTGKEPSS
ncbi:hypothetical protein BDN71DRAFT_1497670 [Pleurotus eryngii]|uniref:Uncharacterized protein n=1 Tax=Pleurotus eryngii TaxID=5323 RepID=A0A9P6DCY0_PLEER|nr:hypothetical protein BDN71DRAFT_1497670 [Pleurotus eryngii]